MNTTNERRAKMLQMPFGTACHRLRKNVLFWVLHRHGENVCYRCNEVIEKTSDLSIEHKEPWLDVSAALFWNIELPKKGVSKRLLLVGSLLSRTSERITHRI